VGVLKIFYLSEGRSDDHCIPIGCG